jgi:hypothetical protein
MASNKKIVAPQKINWSILRKNNIFLRAISF